MEKAVAPMRMAKTMAVIFTVSRAASSTTCQLSLRYMAARIIAPILPTAADSVGVAMPMKIEPSTRKMRINGGITASRARPRLPATVPSRAGMAGATSFLMKE